MGIILKTLPLLALLSACVGDKSQDSKPSGSDSGDSSEDSAGDTDDSGPNPNDDADGDGFAPVDADCDDEDPNTHPSATETAGDGVDSDGDGLDGSAENMYTSASLVMTGGEERPSFGSTVVLPGDVNGDGWDDLLISGGVLGDPDSAEYYTTEVFLLFGPFTEDKTQANAIRWLPLLPEPTVAATGDLDGDGLNDFVIGSWKYRSFATGAGQVWIVYGGQLSKDPENMVEDLEDTAVAAQVELISLAGHPLVGPVSPQHEPPCVGSPSPTSARPSARSKLNLHGHRCSISGTKELTHFGADASGRGDLNGDGTPDLMIGAMRSTAVIVEVEVILTRHSRTPSPKTGIVQV